jgi:hypothetical protein
MCWRSFISNKNKKIIFMWRCWKEPRVISPLSSWKQLKNFEIPRKIFHFFDALRKVMWTLLCNPTIRFPTWNELVFMVQLITQWSINYLLKGWGKRRSSENKGPTTITWKPQFHCIVDLNLTFLPLNKGSKQFVSFQFCDVATWVIIHKMS